MNMTITITLWDALLLIGAILLIILLVYCINFVKNLIPLLKTSKTILDDVSTMTSMTTAHYQEVNEILDDVKKSVGTVSKALKGNENIIAAITSVVNSLAHLKGMSKKKD